MVEDPYSESAWRRGWRDTKSSWTDWRFIVFEAVMVPLLGFTLTWWLTPVVVIGGMFCIWIGATASAPVKQRNEARRKLSKLQSVLGHEEWIEAVIIDAVDLSNKLKNKRVLNSNYSPPPQRDLDDFGDWYSAISEYLQQNLPGEYPSWYRSVYIGNDEPSVTEVLKAYESGLDILEDIRKKFSSSIAHTEGSQK